MNMKKIFGLALIATLLAPVACTKHDDAATTEEAAPADDAAAVPAEEAPADIHTDEATH